MSDEKRTKIVAEIDVEAKEARQESDGLLATIRDLTVQVGRLVEVQANFTQSIQAGEQALEKVQDSTEGVADAQEDVAEGLRDINRNQREAGMLAEVFKGIWQGVGQSVFQLVASGVRGVVGELSELLNWAGEFGDQFDYMSSRGVEGLDDLKDATKELARDIRVDLVQAAKAVNLATQFGKDGVDAIDVARMALQNYQVTQMEASAAIAASGQIVKGFNLAANEQGWVIDQVATASMRAKVNQQDLYDALVKLGPQASTLGIKFGELLAITEAGLKRGIQPMRMGLMGMTDVLESIWQPSEKLAETFQAQGVNVQKLLKEEGLIGYLRLLRETKGELGFSGAAQTFISAVPAQVQVAQASTATLKSTLDGLAMSVRELQQVATNNPDLAGEVAQEIASTQALMNELKANAKKDAEELKQSADSTKSSMAEIWADMLDKGFNAWSNLKALSKNALADLFIELDELVDDVAGLFSSLYSEENTKQLSAQFKQLGEKIRGWVKPIAEGIVADIKAGIDGKESWENILGNWFQKATAGVLLILKGLVEELVQFFLSTFRSKETEIANTLGAVLGRAFQTAVKGMWSGFSSTMWNWSGLENVIQSAWGGGTGVWNPYASPTNPEGLGPNGAPFGPGGFGFPGQDPEGRSRQINVTQHIYGTDPRVTADMVSRRLQDQARLGVTGGRVF